MCPWFWHGIEKSVALATAPMVVTTVVVTGSSGQAGERRRDARKARSRKLRQQLLQQQQQHHNRARDALNTAVDFVQSLFHPEVSQDTSHD